MEWNQQYEIGVKEIDKQHHELFRLVNNIKTAMRNKENEKLIIKKSFIEIVNYTQMHFAYEEKLMRKLHFHGTDNLRIQQEQLINDIVGTLKLIKSGGKYSPIQMFNFLNKWLFTHVITENKNLREFVERRKEAGHFEEDSDTTTEIPEAG